MRKYLLKRLAFMILVLLGVGTITFVVSHVVPGSPVAMWVGPKPNQEQIDIAIKELGLDKPLWAQYLSYVGNLIQGDLGVSLRTHRNVSEELGRRWGATFELVTISMLIAMTLGIPIGIL